MTTTFDHAEDILKYCAGQADVALVILRNVTGGTLRSRGAMMAVTPTSSAGYISNGCVDADIIARARSGQSGTFIYGVGSPYRDIQLPCGGSLEITIFQTPDRKALEAARTLLSARKATELNLGEVTIPLSPRLRIRVAGKGAACAALAELARLTGLDVHIQSPDINEFPHAQHLTDPKSPPSNLDDARTAMVCLFHDHDWEPQLLGQALNGPAFYVGAMGSQRTHDTRCKALREIGLTQSQISRMNGPIGLIPAQRNSNFLAISIMAEIIQTAQIKKLI